MGSSAPAARVASLDWTEIAQALDAQGWARAPAVLSRGECEQLASLYGDERLFRARIDMARYRFGEGEYKYFRYPLPEIVQALREALYARLAAVARRWHERLQSAATYPDTLDAYLRLCQKAGQARPTPLLLRYGRGGYNCLHQDLYGELAFPVQAACLLSRPGADFTGGEFLLVEQRPRAQSRGRVVPLEQGDLVLFANRERPVRGSRGWYRAVMRHGVSLVTGGVRYALGVIFHDAR